MSQPGLSQNVGPGKEALSTAGYNLHWLLRAMARLGIEPTFLCLLQTLLSAAKELRALRDTRVHTPAAA